MLNFYGGPFRHVNFYTSLYKPISRYIFPHVFLTTSKAKLIFLIVALHHCTETRRAVRVSSRSDNAAGSWVLRTVALPSPPVPLYIKPLCTYARVISHGFRVTVTARVAVREWLSTVRSYICACAVARARVHSYMRSCMNERSQRLRSCVFVLGNLRPSINPAAKLNSPIDESAARRIAPSTHGSPLMHLWPTAPSVSQMSTKFEPVQVAGLLDNVKI